MSSDPEKTHDWKNKTESDEDDATEDKQSFPPVEEANEGDNVKKGREKWPGKASSRLLFP